MANVVFENTPKLPLDEFIDALAFEFTDAPYGLLEDSLKRSISRIAERTNLLRRTVFLTTESGVHNYLLEPPDCMDVIAICPYASGMVILCTDHYIDLQLLSVHVVASTIQYMLIVAKSYLVLQNLELHTELNFL